MSQFGVSLFKHIRYILPLLPVLGGAVSLVTAAPEQVEQAVPSPVDIYHELRDDLLSPRTELSLFRREDARLSTQQADALIHCINETRKHFERWVQGTESAKDYPYIERLLLLRQLSPGSISAEKSERCIRALVQAGAGVNDFDKSDRELQSPALHRALTDPEAGPLCLFLLEKGANTRVRTGKGETALVCAAVGNHASLLKRLVPSAGKKSLAPAMARACVQGNAEAVRELLSLGASANASPGGVPLLVTATACGCSHGRLKPATHPRAAAYEQIADLLLRKGADPRAREASTGRTALMFACLNGMEDLALRLLERGASPTASTLPGQSRRISVMECACLGACPRVVEKLLPVQKCNVSDPYYCRVFLSACAGGILPLVEQGFPHMGPAWDAIWGAEGSSFMPLVEACRYGRLPVVRYLVEHGMDPDVYPYTRETPLLVACLGGYVDIVRYLLDKGADPNRASYVLDPLTAACMRGDTEVIELLLKHGATPCEHRTRGGVLCPLSAAVRGGHAASVRLLLEQGAQITESCRRAVMGCRSGRIIRSLSKITGQDYIAHMSLFRAIEVGNLPAVRRCLKEGVSAEVRDSYGYTPLMVAALTGRAEIVDFLLEQGADKEARVSEHQPATALWLACRMGKVDMVRKLLDAGADIEACGRDGSLMSPLTIACWYDRLETVRLLLERGAKRDARAEDGGYSARAVVEMRDSTALRAVWNPPASPKRRGRRR